MINEETAILWLREVDGKRVNESCPQRSQRDADERRGSKGGPFRYAIWNVPANCSQ